MIKTPGAGISQDLLLSKGSETGLMYHFLFELTALEEHKCSSSALSPAPSCCETLSFLLPPPGHLKVKLGKRSQDGISFAYLPSLLPIPKISSGFFDSRQYWKRHITQPGFVRYSYFNCSETPPGLPL